MRIVDITGPIYSGMWHYPPPYPEVSIKEIPSPDWLPCPTYSWSFSMCCQSGTYLETSLHLDAEGPPLIEVPIEDLFMRPTAVIRVEIGAGERIEVEQVKAGAPEIHKGDVIIVDIGWGHKWRNADFIDSSPYFSHDAIYWILDQEPFIFAADTARFDSWDDPQDFFGRFFDQGVLLLAPVVNLDQIKTERGHIVTLPMKVEEACAAPTRTLFVEGWAAER